MRRGSTAVALLLVAVLAPLVGAEPARPAPRRVVVPVPAVDDLPVADGPVHARMALRAETIRTERAEGFVAGAMSTLTVPVPGSDRQQASVLVYRPDVPDTSSLPVVYFLHGYPGAGTDLLTSGVLRAVDRWIAAGGTPFVLAAPDGNTADGRDTEWADDVDGRTDWEQFVTDDLVPAVEGEHPRGPSRRVLAGLSMGGYGALNVGLHHPSVFGQLVSVSGYFHVDDPDGVLGGDSSTLRHNSPDHNVGSAYGRRVLLIDATHEIPLVEGEAERLEPLLRDAGATVEAQTWDGAHGVGIFGGSFLPVVRFLAAGWRRPAA